ncbi:MAG: hypothetical protein WAV55_04565 [Clostridiaceae bacterium]
MKKFINVPALALTVIMTVAMEILMNQNKVDLTTKIVGGLLFLILNYMVVAFILTAWVHLFRVIRLPGVKLKSYAYHLYPVALLIAYAGFLVVMVRLADLFVPAPVLAGVIMAGVVTLILAQLGGSFPGKFLSVKKQAWRLERAGGSLGGFEILGSLIGEYRDGLVIGLDAIPYEKIDKMHRSKDSIIIEGAGEPKHELIIVSERAQDYFIDLLADRLKISKSMLSSSLVEKQKAGSRKTSDLLKKKPEPGLKSADLKRAKPVKLIEAQKKLKAKELAKEQVTVKTKESKQS